MFEDRSIRRHFRKFHRSFYRRPVFWLGLLLVLALGVRLALDPVAAHYTREALADLDGLEGRFADVHVGLLPPSYTITDLRLVERPAWRGQKPLLHAAEIQARLDGGQLLRRRLVAAVRVERPKLTIVRSRSDEQKRAQPLPDLGARLRRAPPLLVRRVEIKDGEVLYRDTTLAGSPELWLHRIEAAGEVLATRPELAGGRPTVVTARAELQRSGTVTLFVSADPFARAPTFAGRAQIRGLRLADLHRVLVAETELQPEQGTADIFAEFRCERGLVTGGVKPVLKDVELGPTDDSLGNRLKTWLADSAFDLFSDRVPGRQAVATTVPVTLDMKGKIGSPEAQLLPTVLGVVRNAFVEGLVSGFANLPPRTAEKQQGAVEQVKDALTGDEPPEAQPRATPGGGR